MRHAPRLTRLLSASALLLTACSSPTTPGSSDRSAAGSISSANVVGDAGFGHDGWGPSGHVEAEIRRASAAEVKAFLAADPATLARLWSNEFVVTNPFNQFVNKQQVLGLVVSGILAFSAYERDIEYMHAYGDIVIVAGSETVVWSGKIPLAGQTSHLRYTSVWARHGNAWKQVARHANLILPAVPSGPPTGG